MHAKSILPSFSKSQTKYLARELHIGLLYPLFTGNLMIPDGKGYWYLCNEQSNLNGSEIHQITRQSRYRDGRPYFFARPEQCYGVDRNHNIIKRNKKLCPDSNWLAEEWIAAIQNQSIFNPALVYLDTTSFADGRIALGMVKETLLNCRRDTLVIANVMMNQPRAGTGEEMFDRNALVNNLFGGDHPQTFAAWNISPEDEREHLVHSYEYKTSKTLMRSYVFFKGVLPPTSEIAEKFNNKDWCSFHPQAEEID